MADEGPKWAALAVTVGLGVSLTPILLRVLPPLAKDAETSERDPDYAVTVVGLILYLAVAAGFLLLLDITQRAALDATAAGLIPSSGQAYATSR